ncbi:hypothetical protein IFM58399_07030 [Aspergillus lentulus]|uniref:Ecp2 effector protein-like domain-containing protein n=1 Tax=Aspergillus lentulus TaxID=293939 RepID=A0ABQ1APZ8_ASPLE|nr:uncharacterized protein IFM58399_07030 [Aspergillus lentulus]GFF43688.1 hypothetical protein IFM58399_07030 [Aspergillus lentulus]GFF67971.1 hypothetical protein IFM62136_07130 [Aspergillus lentulus]GFF85965.1 hypothetical protein IFM60648_07540 [Aspergillus lentulus]
MAKDTTMTIISQSTTIAKDLLSDNNPDKWTAEKHDEFSNYMGQSIAAWGNITEKSLSKLFDGSDDSLNHLTDLISDSKLIEGKGMAPPGPDAPAESVSALRASISKAFFGFAIPSIWTVSGTYASNINLGYDCGTIDPMGDYMDTDTLHATAGCYGGKLHYLASPKGDASTCTEGRCFDNKFSTPPGIDSLDGKDSGGITVGDLITGSVRTDQQNGNQNGGAAADPSNSGTLEDLYNQDITTPGFIRLPVCSADFAFKARDQSGGPYTNTSDASVNVSDCMQIVKNFQNTDGDWEVENAIGNQHQLVHFGPCAFGVQGQGKNGNVAFNIGAQDIVDIITDSVRQFGGSSKVGAKGVMSCDGTAKGQQVEWGLY